MLKYHNLEVKYISNLQIHQCLEIMVNNYGNKLNIKHK